MKEILSILIKCQDLDAEQSRLLMQQIMTGAASEAQIGAVLAALSIKGETALEIAEFAKVMRSHAVPVTCKVSGTLTDLCGTGGDGQSTFNISTAAMFLVAGAGVPVAKHGNRSITSKSGSADVLEAMGVNLDLNPKRIGECIDEVGVGFMFAPNHHPTMKYVMPARKQLGVRTVFNILGPLTNPAAAKAQLMGVFHESLTEKMADVFRLIGLKKALVVHGNPGLDEISICGQTKISELSDGQIQTYTLDPHDLGIAKADIEDLIGLGPKHNAQIIRSILSGEIDDCRRDIVNLNAAGALIAAGEVKEFNEGLELAQKQIDQGTALEKLERFIEFTNRE